MPPVPMDPTNPPGGGLPGPGPLPLDCNSLLCAQARIDLVAARNLVLLKCGQVNDAKNRRDVFAAMAVAFATLALAALVGAATASATIFGIPLGALLLVVAIILASIALTFLTLAGIFEIQRAVIEAELGDAKTKFMAAAAHATASCPATCTGDTSLPVC